MIVKAKTFKIVGSTTFIIGLLSTIYFLSVGIIKDILTHSGDYWLWAFILVPILFILMGGYYFQIGYKNLKVNKLVSSSAIIQFISSIIGIIVFLGYLICAFSIGGYCHLVLLLYGIPVPVLMIIGIILLVIGKLKK